MSDIAERLRLHPDNDHKKGCEGRYHSCDCGYDADGWRLHLEAADEIERLEAGMREYACTSTDHPCGCYDQFISEKAKIARLEADNARLRAALNGEKE